MAAVNKKEPLIVLAQKAGANGTDDEVRGFLNIYSITEVDAIETGLQTQIDSITGDITSIETDIATISGDLDALETDVATISGDVTALQDSISFGEIYIDGSTTSTSVAAGAGYTQITQWSTDGINGTSTADMTPDVANNKITLDGVGKYYVSGSFSFTSNTNNVVVIASLFLDGVEQHQIHFSRKIGTGADIGAASFSGLISADSLNEDIDIRFRHDAAGAVNITLEYANLSAYRIGD